MESKQIDSEYAYKNSDPTWSNYYIWPLLTKQIESLELTEKRIFEIGCGNGATASMLSEMGFDVMGIDPSTSGITQANDAYPNLNLEIGSVYDDLTSLYGTFPLVISFEVIEHCYYPRRFMKTFADLISPGGVGIISTPFHSYLKNLALAVSGKMDSHFTALWDGGHIKFFSIRTLSDLLIEQGFKDIRFHRVGRIPLLAKSMVAVVRK